MEKIKLNEYQIDTYKEAIEQIQAKINDCLDSLKDGELDKIQKIFMEKLMEL